MNASVIFIHRKYLCLLKSMRSG